MRDNNLKTTASSEESGLSVDGDTRVICDVDQQQKEPSDDSILDTFIQWVTKPDKNRKDSLTKQKEKQDKGIKKLNFLKKSRTDKGITSEDLNLLKERLSRLESNPLLQNVHFSRPSTPKSIPSTRKDESNTETVFDRYRVMYLLIRVEQQLDHTRRVVRDMQEKGAKRSRVRSVSKVMRQIDNLRDQLLRILGNDADTIARIGNADDMELFFQNIDDICSAAQEISFEEEGNDALCRLLLGSNGKSNGIISMKDGKVKMKKTGSSSCDLKAVFSGDQNVETASGSHQYRNTKDGSEKYRKRGSKDYISTGNADKSKLMYKSEAVDSWSDTDTDEEMSAVEKCEGQKYKWPLLNTNDEKLLEKEKKLHTLMTEIDELMDDVGLTDKKAHSNGITYEVLMMGSGEMTKATEKKETKQQKIKKFETNPDKFKGAKSVNPNMTRGAKAVKKSKSQSDQFVEEFDKLLNECENKK
ncbi:uncharacterized protein LOC123526805 [Mercenaria mercenaria]|uniref:uncharacterized protein LOC123526805 n=1 Tax=Mercenaria mercenaria TaxID=6596 RepID=UPI00234EAADE|nr:uncharacterized protein LOC123526805 [Mercenaria mercenaria]